MFKISASTEFYSIYPSLHLFPIYPTIYPPSLLTSTPYLPLILSHIWNFTKFCLTNLVIHDQIFTFLTSETQKFTRKLALQMSKFHLLFLSYLPRIYPSPTPNIPFYLPLILTYLAHILLIQQTFGVILTSNTS